MRTGSLIVTHFDAVGRQVILARVLYRTEPT
jgi:hypothetical protein